MKKRRLRFGYKRCGHRSHIGGNKRFIKSGIGKSFMRHMESNERRWNRRYATQKKVETPHGTLVLQEPTQEARDWAVKAIEEKEESD